MDRWISFYIALSINVYFVILFQKYFAFVVIHHQGLNNIKSSKTTFSSCGALVRKKKPKKHKKSADWIYEEFKINLAIKLLKCLGTTLSLFGLPKCNKPEGASLNVCQESSWFNVNTLDLYKCLQPCPGYVSMGSCF